MNDRVPDSSGLPLRAMVMVLLFLGVVLALIGFQAMGSDADGDSSSNATSVPTVTSTHTTTPVADVKAAEVRVFNISEVAGAAERTANQLREDGWNVTETGNLVMPDVPATTVYFGTAEGEQQAAEAVGKVLDAAVAPRAPEVAEQAPGVIVVVTG
jgi:LytR cell envelope-related transcriptional attenuator